MQYYALTWKVGMKFSKKTHRRIVFYVAGLQMAVNECVADFFSSKFADNNKRYHQYILAILKKNEHKLRGIAENSYH